MPPRSSPVRPEQPESLRAHAIDRLRAVGCVWAEEEFEVLSAEAQTAAGFEVMLARRLDGEPLEWVVGRTDFCGHRVPVHRGVFVPRRRTEFLAETAVGLLGPGDTVLDLACGAGAIALVLAATWLPRQVVAADLDAAAVANAAETLEGWPARALQSDLFEAFDPAQRFDLIVANLPYVPTDSIQYMPREAFAHEPRHALDGGPDGLDPLRRCAAGLPGRLQPGGWFLTEVSPRQVPVARSILAAVGLRGDEHHGGDDGCVVAGRAVRSPGPADAARSRSH
jgi:release factor glutamine methyltransferase